MSKNGYTPLPDALLYSKKYSQLSLEEKVIYCAILRRNQLSAAGGDKWRDKQGDTFCYFAVNNVMELVGCSKAKAIEMLRNLEKFGLIRRKKRGQGKPSYVYVYPIATDDDLQETDLQTSRGTETALLEVQNTYPQESNFQTSSDTENIPLEVSNSDPNYKDTNNTCANQSYPSNQSFMDWSTENEVIDAKKIADLKAIIYYNINHPLLLKLYSSSQIECIVQAMVDTILYPKPQMSIGGRLYDTNYVRETVLAVRFTYFCSIIDQILKQKPDIQNPTAYLRACLMNVGSTTMLQNNTFYH